tara:strand:+ start:1676 stop:1942 length:267 start_codon:yes stop_codon:yes gene_type:complete
LKIDIYNSAIKGDKFLSVPKGTKISDLKLPESVDKDLLTLSPFRTRLEVEPGKTHPALDQKDVLRQIEKNGYAIHGTTLLLKIGENSK